MTRVDDKLECDDDGQPLISVHGDIVATWHTSSRWVVKIAR